MKRSLSSMMAALLLVCSCEDPGLLEQFGISPGELDSSNISERLDDLEDRVSKLEAWCDAANSNITALQAAVQALESEDCIVEIVPIEENGAEVGYRFEFKSGKTISVYLYGNSEDGFSGGTMPAIAVKQDTDGSWYWTIDGEWLYNEEGKKVPAVGATPKIKIEDNVWYVSYDEGKTWTAAGDAGDGAVSGGSVFSSVEYDKDYVYFTLTDGSLLTVQRAADFDIVFEGGNEQVYSPNDILEVAYTIAGGDEMSIVKAFASEGWSAKVEKTDAVSGIIRVTSPSESMDGEIIVFVSDGRDKTLMRTLSFESGVMSIIDDTYTVGHEAATIEVRLTTNLDYMVQTDAEWLSVAAGTKAVMREDVLVVTVEENTRGPRTAKIRLSSTSGHELQTISIYQEKDPDSTYWGIIGGLNNWSDDLFMDEIADGLWVAYNVAFEQEINEFKIRANEDWGVVYGMKEDQMLDVDHYYKLMLVSEGGCCNIRVPQGVYDIYLDVNNERLYVMTPGKSIDEALNGTSVVLWEGEHNMGSWDYMYSLSWGTYDWSILKAGMEIIACFDVHAAVDSRFQIVSAWSWNILSGLSLSDGYDGVAVPLENSMTELRLTLTQEDVDAIQESNAGIVIGGCGYTLTKVVLDKSIYDVENKPINGEQEENYPLSDDFDESERYIGLTDIDINIELPISDPILHYQLTDAQELLQLSAEQIRYHMDNAVFDTDGNLVKGMRVCSVYDYGCVDMEMDNNGRLGGWLDSEGQPVPYLSETSVLAISMRCYKNYNDEWCFYDYVSYQLENINGEDNAWGNNKYTNAVNDALGKTIHYTYRITYLPESADGDISLATIVNIHYQVHVVE